MKTCAPCVDYLFRELWGSVPQPSPCQRKGNGEYFWWESILGFRGLSLGVSPGGVLSHADGEAGMSGPGSGTGREHGGVLEAASSPQRNVYDELLQAALAMPTASKLKTDESGRSPERLVALPERDRNAASGRIPVDLFAPVTSKLLAEAGCHQQHATETVPASTAPVPRQLPGCTRAQPTCGSKETAMKGAAASPRARPTEHRINESQSATSGTKLARWVSRAEGKVVSAPKAVVSAPKSALAPNAEQRWLEQKEQAAREAHQLLYRTPTHGSAMEAWMARMSAKQAHLPWPDKFRDPCDEERKLREGSLTAIDILKQRNHLNPPDAQRSYSSIRATEDLPAVSGIGWGRGRLDSGAAWCSADDRYGWMEMDLLEVHHVLGIVTQGQAAMPSGGSEGECRICSPPHDCLREGNVHFAARVEVRHRRALTEDFQNSGEYEIGARGDARCETLFPAPVFARYVRIYVRTYVNHMALRAGVLINPRDHPVKPSIFALKSANAAAQYCATKVTGSSPVATPGSSTGAEPLPSKAARWAARVSKSSAATSPAVSLPNSIRETSLGAASDHVAGGKAARWAAKMAAKASSTSTSPVPQTLLAPSPLAVNSGASAQTACDGLHMYGHVLTPERKYSGFLSAGVPEGDGQMLWTNGAEFHGLWHRGFPHGEGTFYFPNKEKLRIKFTHGCPDGAGLLVDGSGQHWNVEYDGDAQILNDYPQPRLKVETSSPPFHEETIDCMALSVGNGLVVDKAADGTSVVRGNYPNVPQNNRVTAKLVFARPKFGDMPLWNASECRNSIVAICRGPADGHFNVSYSLKIHHAQVAGAKAVIIVDLDPSSRFDRVPVAVPGPVDWGLKPDPPDLDITIQIPTVMILAEKAASLQHGAVTSIHYLSPDKVAGLPPGVKVGFVHIPKQDSKAGLDKGQAATLMAEFFSLRKDERTAETRLLEESKRSGKSDVEDTLEGRELHDGDLFESMNPFKSTQSAGSMTQMFQQKVMLKISQMPVVGGLQKKAQERMRELRQDIEVALPVTVCWDKDEEKEPSKQAHMQSSSGMLSMQKAAVEAGLKIPKVQQKDPRGIFVWRITGEIPFRVKLIDLGQSPHVLPFILHVSYTGTANSLVQVDLTCHNGKEFVSDLVVGKFEKDLSSSDGCVLKIMVSVDELGYCVTLPDIKSLATSFLHMPHRIGLDRISLGKLGVLPLKSVLWAGLNRPMISRSSPGDAVLLQPPPPNLEFDLRDWVLVFRQTAPFLCSNDNDFAEARLLNQEDPNAANYSILQYLEDYRCSDGKFTLLMRWPCEAPHTVNIFRQSSNPVLMEEAGVDDYTPVRIDHNILRFGGLQKTDTRFKPRAACFLDCCDHPEDYFYAIGATKLSHDLIPGPSVEGTKCVELYVTTKDVGIIDEPEDLYGDTSRQNPLCVHGVPKEGRRCKLCQDPLSGHYTIDRSPYVPCTSGHGPRWLWDLSERGIGRKTLCSKSFFQALERVPERAFRRRKWPVLYNTEFEQTACSGYHNLHFGQESCVLLFSGWLSNGLPEGMCSVRWPDGSEYHGEFSDGEMTGYGRYIFPDCSEFRGDFVHALPGNGMYWPAHEDGVRRLANFALSSPSKPLWELGQDQLMHEQMPELPLPKLLWAKADCLGCVNAVPGKGPESHDYKHLEHGVTARLVWARPIFCDQPLWNAEECRGKIVACLRGPRSPAPSCNYSIKLFHAQNSGAAAVVFVDFENTSKFTTVPRVENGPIFLGGPHLQVRIPCFLMLNSEAGALQEGALHTMMLSPSIPRHIPEGWKVGFIFCRKQEMKQHMSKDAENKLMTDFFSQRRQERSEENELLQHQIEDLRVGVSRAIDNKEFISGSVLASLNFSRQDASVSPHTTQSDTVTQAMLAQVTNEERAKELADEAAAAAQSFLSLVQGALGTGTRQGAQDKPPTTAQNCGSTSSTLGGNETPCRHSSPVSGGEDPPSLPHTPKSGLASRFREDRARLLERLQELEQENQHLKEEIAGPRQNPARD